jgi:lia operon protein LiaI
MNKFTLYVGITIAAIIALCALGPMIGIAFSALLVYGGIHFYTTSTSTLSKIFSIILLGIGITSALSNVPGLIGIAAVVVVYFLYKKLNDQDVAFTTSSSDPFTNFEKEWANLTK